MCVVALAWRIHPDWPLILVGNRDEFHARASAALASWDDGSGIVAGRDLKAGGTWLGAHRPSGRVVVVTNVRGAMPDPAKESRGAMVADMLRGDGRFADPAAADLDRFNAFNLFAVDGSARLLTNRPNARVVPLEAGVHALANEPIDSPARGPSGCGRLSAPWSRPVPRPMAFSTRFRRPAIRRCSSKARFMAPAARRWSQSLPTAVRE